MPTRLIPPRCVEIVALGTPAEATFGSHWPLAPGQVRRSAPNRFELLHFAPGRWLAPALTDYLEEQCRRLTASGAAVLIDVDGKWRKVVLSRVDAEHVLRQDLDVELLLGSRECAASTLFDCPAIFARSHSHYHFWVQASYYGNWHRRFLNPSGATAQLVLEDFEKP